jgi:histidinol dehydrogenase
LAILLDQSEADFEGRFAALIADRSEAAPDVSATVRDIIARVRCEGDAALRHFSQQFDRMDPAEHRLAITADEIAGAVAATGRQAIEMLTFARDRIVAHHERQRPQDLRYRDAADVELGWRWSPLEAVGLYVPGGTASYPSSVLMNAVPARVAGVERLVMTVPAPHGRLNPLVLAAAHIAGVSEIYRVGGAHAIAALAYGTETIRPVDKIVGPGNAYVAEAKRQVFGKVGIDMIAGPSEVVVVADAGNDPEWIAADLLAQAEHDANAQSILITDNRDFALAVAEAVEGQLARLPRAATAAASWQKHGAIIIVPALEKAAILVNRIAPEHLQLAMEEAEAFLNEVRHAGAVFIGSCTPEVIGDYVGGSNHVLPTARSARFSSGLSVLDFMKRTSLLKLGPDALQALAPAAIGLARAEGLEAHARSVAIRLGPGS